jgi:hypothetical protein
MAQERRDVAPPEDERLTRVFAAAAGFDVIELLAADRGAVPGIPVKRPPDDAVRDADAADDEEEARASRSVP